MTRRNILFWFVFLMTASISSILFGFVPSSRIYFLEEDQLLENISALAWFSAFAFGTLAVISRWRHPGFCRGTAGIPLLGLLGFLDETSFLGLLAGSENLHSSGVISEQESSPIILFGYTVDGLHDAISVTFKLWRDHSGISGYILGCILLGGLIALLIIKRHCYMPYLLGLIHKHPPLCYLRIAIIMMIVASVLDLNIIHSEWSTFGEEFLETSAGIALGFGGFSMWKPEE